MCVLLFNSKYAGEAWTWHRGIYREAATRNKLQP